MAEIIGYSPLPQTAKTMMTDEQLVQMIIDGANLFMEKIVNVMS